jgi:Ca2+-binding RTX toxin-like protein
MNDGNVAAGQTLYINANLLMAAGGTLATDETLTFNGSAESDGHFIVYSGAGADKITGGAGDDVIYGGGGADQLRGGGGNDTFGYVSTAHSASGATDQILDFSSGDHIDLSAIDAVAGGGNDAFAFVGAAAFSHTAGELRAVEQTAGHWMIEGDTDGNGTADLAIAVTTTDAHTLTTADFVL